MGLGELAGAAGAINPLAVGTTLGQAGLDYYQGLRGEQLTRDTNALNYKMWQEGLEYNKPVNQRKRLEEAGLNPALMYGTGQGANVGAPPPRAEAPAPRGFHIDPGAVVQMQQARLLGEQAVVAKEQARGLKMANDATPEGASPKDSAPMRALGGVVKSTLGPSSPAARSIQSIKESDTPWRSALESFTPMWMHKAWESMKKAGESVGPKYQMRGR